MKLSKRVAASKIYLDRSRSYVGYIQLALIMKVFFKSIGVSSNLVFGVCIVVAFGLLYLAGYLDTRFSIRRSEIENNARNNPVLMALHRKVDGISDRLEGMEETVLKRAEK